MLIEKEDAIKAVCEACYMYKYVGEHYKDCKYYPCDDVTALEAVPEAPKPTGDLISREDAMEAVADMQDGSGQVYRFVCKALEMLSALPLAEPSKGGDAHMNNIDPNKYMQQSPSNGADLISREDAIKAIQKDIRLEEENAIPYESFDTGVIYGLKKALRKICALPTADRPTGQWIEHENYNECNLCHALITIDFNYCPMCGAKMTKGGNDTTGESL